MRRADSAKLTRLLPQMRGLAQATDLRLGGQGEGSREEREEREVGIFHRRRNCLTDVC